MRVITRAPVAATILSKDWLIGARLGLKWATGEGTGRSMNGLGRVVTTVRVLRAFDRESHSHPWFRPASSSGARCESTR